MIIPAITTVCVFFFLNVANITKRCLDEGDKDAMFTLLLIAILGGIHPILCVGLMAIGVWMFLNDMESCPVADVLYKCGAALRKFISSILESILDNKESDK